MDAVSGWVNRLWMPFAAVWMAARCPSAAAVEPCAQTASFLGSQAHQPGAAATLVLAAVVVGGITLAVFLWNFALTRRIRAATAAIRESEARIRGIFDNAHHFLGLLDAGGHVIAINPRALALIAVKESDVNGRRFDLTPWWTHDQASAAIIRERLEAAIQGRFGKGVAHHVSASGEVLTVDFTLKPVIDAAGCVINIIAEGRDVTEVENTRKALETQSADYRSLFENSLAGLFRTRICDGLFLRANDQAARIFGFDKKEDIIGKQSAAPYYIDSSWRQTMIARLLAGGTVSGMPAAIRGADGRQRHFLISATAFPEEGYLEGSMVDISDLKRAETALKDSEARFRAIFESCPVGVGIAGLDGSILNVNQELLRITGYRRRELAGKNFADIATVGVYGDEYRRWQDLQRGAVPQVVFQKELIGRNGESIPVELTGWIVRNDMGAAVAAGAFVRDIRLERQLAREKQALESLLLHTQKMEAIGTLAGGIAHDFNNILSGIIGHAEIASLAPRGVFFCGPAGTRASGTCAVLIL